MVLHSEVFPNYNPLPAIVEAFKGFYYQKLRDHDIHLGTLVLKFEEAGVEIENEADIKDLVRLLTESEILEFERFESEPFLIIHNKFIED